LRLVFGWFLAWLASQTADLEHTYQRVLAEARARLPLDAYSLGMTLELCITPLHGRLMALDSMFLRM
jgi:hypothetical protein